MAYTHTHTRAPRVRVRRAMDRCGPDFVGSAYRFYGETCSRCAQIVAAPGRHGLGLGKRYDRACGADHYDQLKVVHGEEPKVAHVTTGYRHPLRQHDSEE